MTEAISAVNLVKSYGTVKALDGLDLAVETGEVHGYLGPNGAGKTTTLRILLGLIGADSGSARVLGSDPWHEAVELHHRMAYVPGDVNLWESLTGGEVIDMLGRMRGGFSAQRRNELVERFDLDTRKKCRTYSKGNRQKVALIAALASDVELYIFDEPSSGLDPLMEAVFQSYVAELKRAGKTVLLSSHILAEVEALCDRVSIIRAGKIVESGTLAELRHLTRTSVSVETAQPITGLSEMFGIHDLTLDGTRARFQVEPDAMSNVLKQLTEFDVQNLHSHPPTLAELFLRHYGDDINVEEVSS